MRDIDKSRWPLLSPLLDELLDLEPPARAARLAEMRTHDGELAADLEALLARDEAPAGQAFLDKPAMPTLTSAGLLLAGQTVGAYTLEREIGQGGMGSVWLARRVDGRFEGQVAIKFLTAGLLGHGDAGRFAREGQILGRLAHPHIARLIDAGVATDGRQPYLVLEYIDGQPIDRYCSAHQLDTAARVRLFIDVLAAVAHAHNRLILHRDLKPSNILVDTTGAVKLLDFGIAKLLVGDATQPAGAGDLTQRAGNAYTPQYAAPEQVQGGEVTTATDVYALGVLLYLLLGARHPTMHSVDTPLERLRTVVEVEPKRLSDAVREQGSSEAARRARELRGDLDTIVARALKKAPAERYANAAAMADDLRRWLAHEPIAARPDSAAYRTAKFVRRHRLGVAAGSVVTLALATGISIALLEARETERQRVQAEGLIEFMLGDLRKRLEPVGRLDVMDAVGEKALAYYAAQQAGKQDPDSLGRRARALHLMGEVAEKRGRLDEADRMFREAAESTAELLARAPKDGQRVFDHAQSVYWVGYVARKRGQVNEAQTQFELYLLLAQRLTEIAPENTDWRAEEAFAQQNIGVLQLETGHPEAALHAFKATAAVWQQLVSQNNDLNFEMANTFGWSAWAEVNLGHYAAAMAAEHEKIRALDRTPGASTSREVQLLKANAAHQIALMHTYLGETDQAQKSASTAISQLASLVESDRANKDWIYHLSIARIGMLELHAAQVQQKQRGAHNAALLHEVMVDVQQLLTADEKKLDWRCNLQGRLVVLEAVHRAPGARAALQRYVQDMQDLSKSGKTLTSEQQRIVASAELALGDLLAAEAGGASAARTIWQAAANRLKATATGSDYPGMTVLALARWRIGATEDSRDMAEKIRASSYRHPDAVELQRLISLSSSGRPQP